jgi:hypothetical protein
MRSILVAVALALAGAPAAAHADLGLALRLERFDGPRDPAAGVRLELPALSVSGLPALALDDGGGAPAGHRSRVDPAVALILGIIPGFGIGHLVAGSSQWVIWLIADIVIFAVWPGGLFFIDHGNGYNFLGLLVLVERIFEGLSAYQAAGGGPIFRSERGFAAAGPPSPIDLALPVSARASSFR